MPRHMSFSETVSAIIDGSKTVTRRMGWTFLKPGDLLWACEKCQGLKKGEKVNKLRMIRVLSAERELLRDVLSEECRQCNGTGVLYDWASETSTICHRCVGKGIELDAPQLECVYEGFPHLTPAEFVRLFCKINRCMPNDPITRIAFDYLSPDEQADFENA